MKALAKLACLVCVVLLAGCGKTGQTQNNVPTPPDPTTQNNPGNYTPPTNPGFDPRLPSWIAKAAALRLPNPTDYSDLEKIAGVLYLPLVGDPKVSMEISGGRDTVVEGKFQLAFEDSGGFWGAELRSLPKAGTRSTTNLDMIFEDDELVVRTVISVSGDNLDGIVYYRTRTSADTTCHERTVTCTYPPQYQQYCPPPPDYVTECRNTMTVGARGVRQLGSFHAKYSNWIVN